MAIDSRSLGLAGPRWAVRRDAVTVIWLANLGVLANRPTKPQPQPPPSTATRCQLHDNAISVIGRNVLLRVLRDTPSLESLTFYGNPAAPHTRKRGLLNPTIGGTTSNRQLAAEKTRSAAKNGPKCPFCTPIVQCHCGSPFDEYVRRDDGDASSDSSDEYSDDEDDERGGAAGAADTAGSALMGALGALRGVKKFAAKAKKAAAKRAAAEAEAAAEARDNEDDEDEIYDLVRERHTERAERAARSVEEWKALVDGDEELEVYRRRPSVVGRVIADRRSPSSSPQVAGRRRRCRRRSCRRRVGGCCLRCRLSARVACVAIGVVCVVRGAIVVCLPLCHAIARSRVRGARPPGFSRAIVERRSDEPPPHRVVLLTSRVFRWKRCATCSGAAG